MTIKCFGALLLVCVSLVSAGCKKTTTPTDPGTTPGTNTGGTTTSKVLTADRNGVGWSCCTSFTPPSAAWAGGIFSLSGATDGTNGSFKAVLHISMLNVGATGTYSLSPGNPSSANASWIETSPLLGDFQAGIGGSGSITFTTLATTHLVGTFSFSGGDGNILNQKFVTITNGKFDITIP